MILTLTGFDNDCSMDLMKDLCHIKDIRLEIGILYYPKKFGQPRYPDLGQIFEYAELPIQKALHMCGNEAVNDFLNAKGEGILYDEFNRIQLNADWDEGLYRKAVNTIWTKPIILQMNSKNWKIFEGFYPFNSQLLMDESRGNGDANTRNWKMEPATKFSDIGYAGGITVDTIETDIRWVLNRHKFHEDNWIDLESGIRTDNQVDFQKVAEVIEIFSRVLAGVL